MLYAILKPIVAACLRVLCRLEAHGIEHVPRAGAVLLVANHSSVLDPPAIGAAVPRQMTFLAKAELFRIPLFGPLLRRLNAHPVRREGADAGALRAGRRALGEHRVLLTFPEGTRGEEGVLRPAKPGAGMLAVLSGAPVVPVYVRGSGRAWPKGRRLPRPAKISVYFGPALALPQSEGGERRDHYETASRAMMAAIAALKERATAAGCAGAPSPLKYTQGRNGQHGHG